MWLCANVRAGAHEGEADWQRGATRRDSAGKDLDGSVDAGAEHAVGQVVHEEGSGRCLNSGRCLSLRRHAARARRHARWLASNGRGTRRSRGADSRLSSLHVSSLHVSSLHVCCCRFRRGQLWPGVFPVAFSFVGRRSICSAL